MDTWSDLWDALPADDNLYSLTNIPPARADATVNILSLPIELLRSIIELCNNRSILALMRVNRALHLVALWKFYANVHIPASRHDAILSSIDHELSTDEMIPHLFKKQFGVLGGVLRRREHMATIHQLHIVDFPWSKKAEITFHRIIRYILDNAVSVQTLIFPRCNSTTSTFYDGLVSPSSLSHIRTPSIDTSLMKALVGTARLTSLQINSECATFSQLLTLGEQIGSALRQLECVIHIPPEEWDSSVGRIEEFASKFPRLNALDYGYCSCDLYANTEVPVDWYTRMAGHLPDLTSITIKDYRHSSILSSKDEHEIVWALFQANKQLSSIGITYQRPYTRWNIVWRAAPPSVAESSKDAKGKICIWTPDPSERRRWSFWFDTFGAASIAYLAMSQRWPGANLPSAWEIEFYSGYPTLQ
ncbi:hypothetical protein CPB86DRAFT_391246 [Serendipita vermifera]|nr:hypothetical protein CPB86DRAFT_391246 [Serendipita vermifera]